MPDDIKPWTIKNVSPEVRNAAIQAATREQMTIGAWLERAIRAQVQVDHQQDRAPAIIEPPFPTVVNLQSFDVLDRVVNLGARISTLPEPLQASTVRFLQRQLRDLHKRP